MATTNFSVKYRPARIGFLVKDGSIEDLVKASQLNTLLWGGIRNPIIPVSTNPSLAKKLIEVFYVDYLYSISHDPEVNKIWEEYKSLKIPYDLSQDLMQEDWHTKKNELTFLDTLNLIEYFWERDFKYSSKTTKSNCLLPKWNQTDPLANLFEITLGSYPSQYNLRDNFERSFLRGLKSTQVKLARTSILDPRLASGITPLTLTDHRLKGYGGHFREDGVYIGDPNSFVDLINFWNLRAAGINIEFIPLNYSDRVKAFIKKHVARLDSLTDPNSPFAGRLELHCSSFGETEYKKISKIGHKIVGKKDMVLATCSEDSWNGLNIKPADYYFNFDIVTANVDYADDRYKVTIPLPEKPVVKDSYRELRDQIFMLSISALSEFEYPDYTLKLPPIRDLNEFYSREIVFDPWDLKVQKDSFSTAIKISDNYKSLYPLKHQTLLTEIFEYAGIKSQTSQAGLIAKRVIEKLGGVDARILKIKGVRNLLQNVKPEESISRGEATKKIWDNGNFQKHEGLYIEPRETEKLKPGDIFDYLLKRGFFRAGLELKCQHCNLPSWLSLKAVDDIWVCDYCGHSNQTSLHLIDRGDWRFRKSGLFAKDNNQEGAVPVVLTLSRFLLTVDYSNFIYSTSLNLSFDNKGCEIDFAILQNKRLPEFEIGIGECKSEGGTITQEDVDNLKLVREKFKTKKIECCLIFSKTADTFIDEELSMFKKLNEERIPVILLTNKELEPYDLYENSKRDKLPHPYSFSLQNMAQNSEFLYLS